VTDLSSGLWDDLRDVPQHLRRTLDATTGMAEVISILRNGDCGRIILTGNGASYYAGLTAATAALLSPTPKPWLAVPAGLLLAGRVELRKRDVLIAISSSGELRDIIESSNRTRVAPMVAITADSASTIARTADVAIVLPAQQQRAVTHTGAFAAAALMLLKLLARSAADTELETLVEAAPESVAQAIELTDNWIEILRSLLVPAHALAFGSGTAWAAALETALLLKEVSRIPSEGVETREAATSSMTAIRSGDVAVAIQSGRDDLLVGETAIALKRAGASVVELPGAAGVDERLSPLLALPAGVALAIAYARRAGRDPDAPDWYAAYLDTARAEANPP
jgi:fructoselysine-6-P-deglycase FrlB-like protein